MKGGNTENHGCIFTLMLDCDISWFCSIFEFVPAIEEADYDHIQCPLYDWFGGGMTAERRMGRVLVQGGFCHCFLQTCRINE